MQIIFVFLKKIVIFAWSFGMKVGVFFRKKEL